MMIRVQSEPFDPGKTLNAFTTSAGDSAGAVVSFSGIVRDTPDGDLRCMEIEHYPGMTEKALTNIAQTASARWSLSAVLVIHRFGGLRPGEPIMMVATAAPHRAAAFEAAEFLMDYLKSRAPFWKKEIRRDGSEWVESRSSDEAALKRW